MIKVRDRLALRIARSCAALAVTLFAAASAQAESFCVPGPNDRPETGLQGSVPGYEKLPPLGFQGFWCGVRKVAQHALWDRGSFGDLQIYNTPTQRCAYASMRDPSDLTAPTTGTVVLDVSIPSEMKDVRILRTPAMIRAYSGLELVDDQLVGAYKDFGPNGTNPLDVYTLSPDCLNPTMLSTSNTASGNHDGWLSPDKKTWYGIPFGGNDIRTDPSRIDMHITDISDPRNPRQLLNWNRTMLPPEIYAITKNTRNWHDVSTNAAGTRLYMVLYGGGAVSDTGGGCHNGMLILDNTDVTLRRPNPKLRFVSWTSWCDSNQTIDPDFGNGASAAGHATEYVIHENGKEYVVTTDEGAALGGEAAGPCTQHTYSRMIDITDELHPQVVGTFKPDANKPENCATNVALGSTVGMVHYIGFQDRYKMRLVFYASSNQGLRIVDWRDPAHPKEVAYYQKERHTTTPINQTDFTRPDPRYDSENCLIYTGWNQGGLVSIEMTDPEYNPCLKRRASGSAWLSTGTGNGRIQVALDAQRAADGPKSTVRLSDPAAGVEIRMNTVTRLGSALDRCGPVQAQKNSVQIDGTGTYNGQPASFRVCVQDAGVGSRTAVPDRFHLTCTAGCNYTASGPVGGGNLIVTQPEIVAAPVSTKVSASK